MESDALEDLSVDKGAEQALIPNDQSPWAYGRRRISWLDRCTQHVYSSAGWVRFLVVILEVPQYRIKFPPVGRLRRLGFSRYAASVDVGRGPVTLLIFALNLLLW